MTSMTAGDTARRLGMNRLSAVLLPMVLSASGVLRAAQPSPAHPAPSPAGAKPAGSSTGARKTMPASTDASATAARPSYLVLPPENRSDNRTLYWLGEALADGMEKALSASGVDVATRDERRDI